MATVQNRILNGIKEIPVKELPSVIHNNRKGLGLSESFNVFKTSEVLKVLDGEHNIVPVGYLVASKDGIGKHAVYLRKREHIISPEKALKEGIHSFPEILIENSNSGTSAFKMLRAEMVNKCANGLVIATDVVENFRALHRGHSIKEVIKSIHDFMKNQEKVTQRIEFWKKTNLPNKAVNSYIKEALMAKYGDKQDLIENIFSQFTAPIRENEDQSNLWTLYNNTEERLTKSGFVVLNKRSSRTMKSFGKIELEKRLSKITEKYFLKYKN